MNTFSRIVNFVRLLFANRRHRHNVSKSRRLLEQMRNIKAANPETAAPRIIGYLRKIDPYVFEELILSAFESRGYFVLRGLRYSGDGGFDGRVYFKKRWWMIQAKRYSSHVRTSHVVEFDQQLQARNCHGFFIHTGKTSEDTMLRSKSSRTKIVSGHALFILLTSGG